jgi:cephalosporin-C deacetylase
VQFFDLQSPHLEHYRSSARLPADFSAFWDETLAEARNNALTAQFQPVDHAMALLDIFDVTFPGFGAHPIRGWYMLPRGVRPRGTVVKFIGYGGGRGLPHEHLFWPSTGRALLVMDTRGQGSTWSQGDTTDPVGAAPAHPGYLTRGIENPRDYYYRRVFTDGVRAVDAVLGRQETDPSKLAVAGISQGGGITIAVAGLHGAVRAAMPDVPGPLDFPRALGLTGRDPFQEIVRYLSVHRDKTETAFETLNYFDGVHFAGRATCASLFSVALMDQICAPSTIYAAFNAWGGPKSIEVYRFNGHEGGGTHHERKQAAWLDLTLG